MDFVGERIDKLEERIAALEALSRGFQAQIEEIRPEIEDVRPDHAALNFRQQQEVHFQSGLQHVVLKDSASGYTLDAGIPLMLDD